MLPIKQLQMLSNLCTECALVMLYEEDEVLKSCRVLGFQQFGSSDSVQMNIQDIIDIAKETESTTIRLVHNHPNSTEPEPSMPDIIAHTTIKNILKNEGITLLDSLVVAAMKIKTYGGHR